MSYVEAQSDVRRWGRAGLRLRGICAWRGAARAAYSIVHDDVGQPEADGALAHGLPELSQRSLRAGFACVVGEVERRALWPQLAALVGDGHEVLNHSWDHVNLVESPDYAQQIDRPQELCERRLAAFAPRLFAFPYDAFDEAALDHLRSRAYAGARAGHRGIDSAQAPADDFGICFDTYGPEYSVYDEPVLDAHVDAAIASGGWALREFHGVEDASWETISRSDYARHLDRLVECRRLGELWIDTPSEIAAYRRRRAQAGMCELIGDELYFSAAQAQDGRAGTLTVDLKLDDDFSLHVTQAGQALDCQPLRLGCWLLKINPFAGPAKIVTRRLGSRAHFHPLETSLS